MKPEAVSAFLLLLYFGSVVPGVLGENINIDLNLNDAQKKVLDKFGKLVRAKLPHKYMKTEVYLVNFLRARNFDVKQAEEFLLQNLKWRKQNKMDTIHLEDFRDVRYDFPYYIDTYDKAGRPVITAISREWDIRNAVVTGRIKRVLRYLGKGMEEAAGIVRRLQQEGENITQFSIILHLGNFNLYQHGCPKCITNILELVTTYENHYPGLADKILLVQTPPLFDPIAQVVRESMSPQTREAMKIYGVDTNVWKKILFEFIDPSQLTADFGGTKPDPIDV